MVGGDMQLETGFEKKNKNPLCPTSVALLVVF